MHINRQKQEINLKIVYYGPAYSGKTTNLEQLHQSLSPQLRSDLTSIQNEGDRTLFFDYMQLAVGKIGNLTPRFNLYTVPGQVRYAHTRKIVLRGVDAVVFVADSGMNQVKQNVYSWQQLQEQLLELGIEPATLPVVVQLNKRDMPDALPVPIMKRLLRLTERPEIPVVEATAVRNIGTRETLHITIKNVLQRLQVAV
jgi:mutual gliding-motility protein MglA